MREWKLLAVGARCCIAYKTINPQFCARSLGRYSSSLTMRDANPGDAQGPRAFSYAYCHGFLSGPTSVKGEALKKSLWNLGIDLHLLNLNGPDHDPGAITCSGALQAVREFHQKEKAASEDPRLKLRLVGSSLGGYVAARYAHLYPDEVDRIFMLCPAFGIASRAPKIVDEEEAEIWKRDGSRMFALSTGGEAKVPWSFIEDTMRQVDLPEYECPAAIVHGLGDEVVPASLSRDLVESSTELAKRTLATFVEDDHSLTTSSTMDVTVAGLIEFFELGADSSGVAAAKAAVAGEETPESKESTGRKDVEELVASRGGILVGEQVFTDVYWDAPECGLTARSWWLRSRAGRWELKRKVLTGRGTERTSTSSEKSHRAEAAGAEAYQEVTSAQEIARELTGAGVFSRERALVDDGVLKAEGFTPFASFRTNRTKFKLEGYTVDIDQASFGHQLVEIETMSGSGTEDIEAASEGVAALAQSLGLTRDGISDQATRVRAVPAANVHDLCKPSPRPVFIRHENFVGTHGNWVQTLHARANKFFVSLSMRLSSGVVDLEGVFLAGNGGIETRTAGLRTGRGCKKLTWVTSRHALRS